MSDIPSPELKSAYEDLEAAIKKVAALETDGPPAVLVEWVVLTASTHYKEDGAWTRSQMLIPDDNDIPHYRILGLLEFASTRLRKDIADDD